MADGSWSPEQRDIIHRIDDAVQQLNVTVDKIEEKLNGDEGRLGLCEQSRRNFALIRGLMAVQIVTLLLVSGHMWNIAATLLIGAGGLSLALILFWLGK